LGEQVPDDIIVSHLKDYRSDVFMSVEGGAKVLSKYFRRDHQIIVNHKKLGRLCKQHGLQLKQRSRKKSKFSSPSKNHTITRANQVWEFDIKYGYLHGERRFFFLVAFIDVFTREIRGWYLGRHCKAQDILSTLMIALDKHAITPEMELTIRSDNGPQMGASRFAEALAGLPASHEFIPLRTPNKNAHLRHFWDLPEAYHWTLEIMDLYNEVRIHGGAGMGPRALGKLKELHGEEMFMQAI
jgi:putative transposase